MTTHRCPNCGCEVQNAFAHGVTFVVATGVVTHQGRTCRLTPFQIDLLEVLLEAYPRSVSIAHLMADLYENRSDAEMPGSNGLSVQVTRMREKLRDLGINIIGRNGRGERSGYALVFQDVENEQIEVA